MITVRALYDALNGKIPTSLSCDWDNDGLMCCPDPDGEVFRVLVALDVTEPVIDRAVAERVQVIVTHHPLIFSPIRSLTPDGIVAKKLIRLVREGIAVMSFHTRLDALADGVNDRLAATLGLENVRPFGAEGEEMGRVGEIAKEMTLGEFAEHVRLCLSGAPVSCVGGKQPVRCVAVLGGSGASELAAARRAGADTFVTGEMKYHELMDAADLGYNVITAGHFHTENMVCEKLAELVRKIAPTACVEITHSNRIVSLG